ncbi:hypothetical protein CSPX01_08664 [Colletotrichum filicis]|nr:hypothetical protein CSPX01_08664 [Colletotrichum filicis]
MKFLIGILATGLPFLATADSARIDRIQARQSNSTSINIRDAVANPNATGTWPINGIDVTEPLLNPPADDYGPGNGWSINIAVATNISADGISTSVSNPAVITLEGPENAFQGLNSTTNYTENYDICSFAWFENVWTVKELEKLQDDVNGTCNGVISEECIKETKEALVRQPCSTFRSFEKPKSCPQALSSPSSFRRNVTFDLPNGTSTDESSSSHLFGIWGPYSNRSEAGLHDAYDTALTNVYPVLLAYNYGEDSTEGKKIWPKQHLARGKLHLTYVLLLVFVAGVSNCLPPILMTRPVYFGAEPLRSEIRLKTSTRVFQQDYAYAMPPSPEVDAAWSSLLPQNGGFFTHPTLAPTESCVAVFHQIHCLDMLRKALYEDLTIEVANVVVDGVTGFDTEHQCIDWSELMDWMKKNE